MTTNRGRVIDALVVIGLCGGAALYWEYRIHAPGTQFHGGSGDLFTQIYPMVFRAAAWIKEGVLPLWNPYQLCGYPFAASVLYGVFYPLNALLLTMPADVGLEVIVIVHLALAAVLTYAYLRTIDVSRIGAVAGAATYALSGFFASQVLWFPPAVEAATWLPLGLIAIERTFTEPRLRWGVALAIAVAMPALAGWLQTWTYSVHALAAYGGFAFMRALWRRERTTPRALAILAAGAVAGVALAAIQLVPSMELQSLGPRRTGGLSLQQMLTLGPVSPTWIAQGLIDSTPAFPRMSYVGIVPLLLAPFAFSTAKHRGTAVFFLMLALWSLAVSATVFTPVFSIFQALPGGRLFRVPWRMLLIFTFSAAALTAMAFDGVAERSRGQALRGAMLPLIVTAIVAALVVRHTSSPQWTVVYVVLGVIALVAALASRSVVVHRGVALGLLAILGVDLFLATRNPAEHPVGHLFLYDQERNVLNYLTLVQNLDRTYFHASPFAPTLMPKMGTLRRIYSITDYEPLSLERYGNFYRLLERPTVTGEPNPFIGFMTLSAAPESVRLLDLMSVRFVVLPRKDIDLTRTLRTAGWEPIYEPPRGTNHVLASRSALPRAYVATTVLRAADGADALARIADASFDAHRAVVIEPLDGSDASSASALDGDPQPVQAASIKSYQPMHVVVELDTPRDGMLVLTDTYYPGWIARVDGAQQPIQRANYLFRGVRVTPGHHVIDFEYTPWSFRIGASVTGATVVALAIALLLDRRMSRVRTEAVPADHAEHRHHVG